MSDASSADDSKHIEELYKYVERLNEATDKSQVRSLSLLFLSLLCF